MALPEEQEVKPELSIEPPLIEFGAGTRSFLKFSKPDLILTIKNTGSGILTGRIKPQVSWLSISPDEFTCSAGESSEHHIQIQKDARYYWDARGRFLNNLFLVISNAGSTKINGSYKPASIPPARAFVSWLLIATGLIMIAALVVIGFFTNSWNVSKNHPQTSVELL